MWSSPVLVPHKVIVDVGFGCSEASVSLLATAISAVTDALMTNGEYVSRWKLGADPIEVNPNRLVDDLHIGCAAVVTVG